MEWARRAPEAARPRRRSSALPGPARPGSILDHRCGRRRRPAACPGGWGLAGVQAGTRWSPPRLTRRGPPLQADAAAARPSSRRLLARFSQSLSCTGRVDGASVSTAVCRHSCLRASVRLKVPATEAGVHGVHRPAAFVVHEKAWRGGDALSRRPAPEGIGRCHRCPGPRRPRTQIRAPRPGWRRLPAAVAATTILAERKGIVGDFSAR